MNAFKYTPIRSPSLKSAREALLLPPTVPPSILAILRNRLYLSLSVAGFLTVFLLAFANPFSRSSEQYSFPSNGLHKPLWEHLNAIQWREFVLEPVEITWTAETDQDAPVPWVSQDLLPRPEKGARKTVVHPGTGPVDDAGTALSPPRHRIEVFPRKPVLPATATRPSKMIFGIVTTVERAMMMSALWTRWMVPPDGEDVEDNRPACLILLSKDEQADKIEELATIMKGHGLKCALRQSEQDRYEIRVLSMIVEMRDYAADIGREFDWYVFNDDDTFWIDLRSVRRMLSKYDPLDDWFVGANTEAKHQLEAFGRMAFGGAGILVSDALGLKMFHLYEDCFERFRHVFGGDEMITRCAAVATGLTKATVTTEEKGLHQFDVPGDTTGVLQSGLSFLNLHHFIGGTWVHLFGYGSYRTDFEQISVMKRVMEFVGGDNMFKRYVFGDGKWLLTQGYSLTIFEEPLKASQLSKMEHTWYEGYRLAYQDRPPIPERHDWDGMTVKQTFYIDDITVLSPSSARMTYVMADKWDEHLTSADRVRIDVLWDGCWQGGKGCEKTELLV